MSGDRALLVEPLIHLGALDPFRALSHRQLTAIAAEAEEVVHESESWLIRKGDPTKAMHLIVDGYVAVVGRDATTTVGPGELVGYPDLLVTAPSPTGARADTEVVTLRLETDALRYLCEHNFAILSSLLSHLAGGVADDREGLARFVAGGPPPGRALAEGELDRVGRLLALHRSPAFPASSMDALAELAGHVRQVTLPVGRELWAVGSPAEAFWVVCSGSLELTQGETRLSVAPGAVPGLVETLAARSYEYRARAGGAVTLLEVSIDPFMDLLEDHFELAYSFLGWLAHHRLPVG